jgi:hypothetical protein
MAVVRRLQNRLAIAVVVVATLVLGVSVAYALTQSQASTRGQQLASWKAACGQGYWNCLAYINHISGPYSGAEQWSGYTKVYREHGTDIGSEQLCTVYWGLSSTGVTTHLSISCVAVPGLQ